MNSNSNANKNKNKEDLKDGIVTGLALASPLWGLILPDDLTKTNESFGNRNSNYNEIQSENYNENHNDYPNNNELRYNYKYENNKFELPKQRPQEDPNTITTMLMKLFNLIIGIYAIYLTFSCNKGFNLGAFLVACCCPWLYIIYAFAALKCYK